ncbi:hypothetical protein HYX12_03595 [Candidatus Woesearchaeota archaeon]|nr:hypothetical protein [Candidatus Woesearchaeota archaeon]
MHGQLNKLGKWGELHEESELLAIEAEKIKDPSQSRETYRRAAEREEQCLEHVPWQKPIEFYEHLVVSAAALYFKGGDYRNAQRIIDTYQEKVTAQFPKMRLDEVVEALSRINE